MISVIFVLLFVLWVLQYLFCLPEIREKEALKLMIWQEHAQIPSSSHLRRKSIRGFSRTKFGVSLLKYLELTWKYSKKCSIQIAYHSFVLVGNGANSFFSSYANASHLSLGESRGVATSLFANGTAKVSLWYILWLLHLQWFRKISVPRVEKQLPCIVGRAQNGAIRKGQIDH